MLRNESHPNSPLVAGGCDRTAAPPTAATKTRAPIDRRHAWLGFIQLESGVVLDSSKEPVWNVVDAWIKPDGSNAPASARNVGWLLSKRFAEAWLTFEKSAGTSHNPFGMRHATPAIWYAERIDLKSCDDSKYVLGSCLLTHPPHSVIISALTAFHAN